MKKKLNLFTKEIDKKILDDICNKIDAMFDALTSLRYIIGVDAIAVSNSDPKTISILVLAKEHGIVDREKLLIVEYNLRSRLPDIDIKDIVVIAHQGRDFKSIVDPNYSIIYYRENV